MAMYTSHWITLIVIVWACAVSSRSASRQKRSQKCYEPLGCYSNDSPFNNTDGILPQPPNEIATTFRLFTRTCRRSVIVTVGTDARFSTCGFDPNRPTKLIIHGFLQHGQVSWVTEMARELLIKDDMNVLAVDWGHGSGIPYHQAAANTRVVGAEVARMVNFLLTNLAVSSAKVHLIGHSLGAHVCGYAGNQVRNLGRITGLDPADPDFKDTDEVVHLDKTDAMFVDVIHSDGSEFDYVSGFGWMKAVGHVDFYPNGGEDQPGCPPETVRTLVSTAYSRGLEDAEDVVSCSHSRAIFLFTESINSQCQMIGHPCPSLAALDRNQANCFRCASGACPEMGYNAFRTTERGKFYLRTRGNPPFCGYSQHVEIQFGAMVPTSGHVRLEIVGRDQSKDTIVISSDNQANSFISGGVSDILAVDRERVNDVEEIRVTYIRPSSSILWWFSSSSGNHYISVSRVTLTSSEDGRSIHFCGEQQTVTNGNTVVLRRSSTNPNECLYSQSVRQAEPRASVTSNV